MVPEGPHGEIRLLRVKVNKTNIANLPTMYANYAEVRANPEETYFLLCLRQDLNLTFSEEHAESVAEPIAVIMMSTTHAERFARAILSQVDPYLSEGGDSK